jgi:hypothetical protein
MLRRIIFLCFLLLPLSLTARPIVVELYTSEGCAACPPAEALMGELVGRKDVLPLTFHVTYWDHLGWKDGFGLEQSDKRQKIYNTHYGIDSYFTPQAVVDGLATCIGSQRKAMGKIMTKAYAQMDDIPVQIRIDKEKNEITVKVSGLDDNVDVRNMPMYLDVWLVTFAKGYRTNIEGGENVGKDVPSYNIVRRLVLLGKWNQRTNFYRFPLDRFDEDALAILVQGEEGGRIMGVGTYYQR